MSQDNSQGPPSGGRAPVTSRIRPVSRDDNGGRLKGLKCFAEVHDRLCRGFPMPDIAKWIQEEQKEYTEVNRTAVIRALYRYKDTIPPGQLVVQQLSNDSMKKARERTVKGIDELAELDKLFQLQMERVEIDVKTEKDIGKLLPTTANEIRLAADLAGKHAKLRQELGLMPKKLGTLEVTQQNLDSAGARYGSRSISKVLNNPESRRKVVTVAQHLISFLGDGDASALMDQLSVTGKPFETPGEADVIDVPSESVPALPAPVPASPGVGGEDLDEDQLRALEEGEALLAAELAEKDAP